MSRSLAKITLEEAKAKCRALGFSLNRVWGDELRLNIKGGSEGTAYYTNDLEDAVDTAHFEHHRRQRVYLSSKG